MFEKNNKQLNPGEWRINRFDDGTWEFRARYQMELSDLLPSYIRCNVAIAVILYLVFLGLLLAGVGFITGWRITSLLRASPLCIIDAFFYSFWDGLFDFG